MNQSMTQHIIDGIIVNAILLRSLTEFACPRELAQIHFRLESRIESLHPNDPLVLFVRRDAHNRRLCAAVKTERSNQRLECQFHAQSNPIDENETIFT